MHSVLVLVLLAFNKTICAPSAGSAGLAQTQALIGCNELHLGRIAEAQSNCDAALKLDVANETAKKCLDAVAAMTADADLNSADAKLLSGKKAEAVALASKWANSAAYPNARDRAWKILNKAQATIPAEFFDAVTPSWLRQALITMAILSAFAALLLALRKLWREWQRGKWYGSLTNNTKWTMLPLREIAAEADKQTGIATNLVLDAFGRLGHELQRTLWEPMLLLLRPTPPADYEPAIIDSFLPEKNAIPIVLAPKTTDLCLEWTLHDVQLHEAVQNLQLKAGNGLDIGSVARFLRSIVDWFNVGVPTISGIAENQDKVFSIHLAASGGRIKCAAVTASTEAAPGIDSTQLSAERAAFKFLFRMRYPGMTTDEIDGFSALRQGVVQFAQYAGTVPGVGDNAVTRTSSLAKAAFNLNFFRASIPARCQFGCVSENTSLAIGDEIRKAVLLAEGVAYALIASEHDRLAGQSFHRREDHVDHSQIAKQNHLAAIDCFRQLQDWPTSDKTLSLRQQAIYNEAIEWREMGYDGRAVLMLTELLGEQAPDTIGDRNDSRPSCEPKPPMSNSIRLPVRLARLSAFAQYDKEKWTTFPTERAKLLIDDAEELIQDLRVLARTNLGSRDDRLLKYMYVEALRALGHVTLLRVISDPEQDIYENDRPTGLKRSALNEKGAAELDKALVWLRECEQLSPTCELYCDLAEAYLLQKQFKLAEGYGRHATLESDPRSEAAYYIAAESFFVQGTDESIAFAKKYAQGFTGTVTLEKFKSLRRDLGLSEGSVLAAHA
jgi:hypothetical protein